RTRPIHEIRCSLRANRRRWKIRDYLLASFPRRKQRLNPTHDIVVTNVAGDNEKSVIRHELATVKLHEVVACRTIDRLRRRRHNRVRMLAKHHTRNHLTREKRRLRSLLSQTLLRILLRELDFVCRKRRLEDHFRHQVEYLVVEI